MVLVTPEEQNKILWSIPRVTQCEQHHLMDYLLGWVIAPGVLL